MLYPLSYGRVNKFAGLRRFSAAGTARTLPNSTKRTCEPISRPVNIRAARSEQSAMRLTSARTLGTLAFLLTLGACADAFTDAATAIAFDIEAAVGPFER